MNTNKYCPSGLKYLFLLLAITVAGIGSASAQVCSNGSAVDCNPAGSTLIASSAFVDPTPPAGYTQCAGFINTSGDDVRWDWENNCAALVDDTGGGLFMRVFDDTTGAILAGSRLYAGVPLSWVPTTGFNFRTDLHEGEGFLDNPDLVDSSPGTSLAFSDADTSYCGCSRPPSGTGSCNDIYTANAANDKIFYVGGNSTNHAYEAVYAPPNGKGSCTISNETVALRVAIYAGESTAEPSNTHTFATTVVGSGGVGVDPVDLTISCNGGLPLTQTAASGTTFTVTELADGQQCSIALAGDLESGWIAGSTMFGPLGGPLTDGTTQCTFTVQPGISNAWECTFELVPEPFVFSANFMWEISDEADPGTGAGTIIDYGCLEVWNSDDSSYTSFTDSSSGAPGAMPNPVFTPSLTPDPNGNTTCFANVREGTSGSAVTVDESDCANVSIKVGDGNQECDIYMTAFFEGIPTLNQYGVAIMTLLILSLGFVGFRRFV